MDVAILMVQVPMTIALMPPQPGGSWIRISALSLSYWNQGKIKEHNTMERVKQGSESDHRRYNKWVVVNGR